MQIETVDCKMERQKEAQIMQKKCIEIIRRHTFEYK